MTLFEYVWLDGNRPQGIRSKIKVIEDWNGDLDTLPVWNFDGSSTNQAPGSDSELSLVPVGSYRFKNKILVLCEVFNSDGKPHESNTRYLLRSLVSTSSDLDTWWGFEQEYFITKDSVPIGFSSEGIQAPQGQYYCGVGGSKAIGRDLAEYHILNCLSSKLKISGMNAEVAPSQWEYQCFSDSPLKAADDLIVSRYILLAVSEEAQLDINFEPKPIKGDWNGSGCHTNFSSEKMRDRGGEAHFKKILSSLERRHSEHISEYGESNQERLTGEHETQHYDSFSWGVADRGASIRIPNVVVKNNWKGYLEDRRPAANCDPYTVIRLILEALYEVEQN